MTIAHEHLAGDKGLVVVLEGRLDGMGAPAVEAFCLEQIQAGVVRLLLDLEGVDYISSAGLRSLLVVAKRLQTVSGGLRLCCLAPMVQEVLSISGLSGLLPSLPTRQEGIAALA